MLYEMYDAVQREDWTREQELFGKSRDGKTAQQVCAFLYGTLANARLTEMTNQIAGRTNAASKMNTQNGLPGARPREMDIV